MLRRKTKIKDTKFRAQRRSCLECDVESLSQTTVQFLIYKVLTLLFYFYFVIYFRVFFASAVLSLQSTCNIRRLLHTYSCCICKGGAFFFFLGLDLYCCIVKGEKKEAEAELLFGEAC